MVTLLTKLLDAIYDNLKYDNFNLKINSMPPEQPLC